MSASRRHFAGFTLIEMLLVIAIIGVCTAVIIPSLQNSIKGSRLKTAARIVISSGRYARSMAVLKQQPVQVMFDLGASTITVTPVSVGPARAIAAPSTHDDSDGATGQVVVVTGTSGNETIKRTLERVKISDIEVESSSLGEKTGSMILYNTNGRCAPYTITLLDEYGKTMVIHVDALASATTEQMK